MKAHYRRYVTSLAVILAGVLFILLDTPVILLIPAVIMVGILFLILTGSIHLTRSPTKESRERGGSEKSMIPETRVPGPKKIGGARSTLGWIHSHINQILHTFVQRKAPLESHPQVSRIDQMLDSLIAESPPTSRKDSTPPPPITAPASGIGIDPLRELSSAQLLDDLLPMDSSEDSMDEDVTIPPNMSPVATKALSPQETRFQANHTSSTSSTEDPVDSEDAEGLEFPMNSLEDVERDLEETLAMPLPFQSGPEAKSNAPPLDAKSPKSEMIGNEGFSQKQGEQKATAGVLEGDDFIASLKTEATVYHKVRDLSLLRDLVDEHPDGRKLEAELEWISRQLNVRSHSADL